MGEKTLKYNETVLKKSQMKNSFIAAEFIYVPKEKHHKIIFSFKLSLNFFSDSKEDRKHFMLLFLKYISKKVVVNKGYEYPIKLHPCKNFSSKYFKIY